MLTRTFVVLKHWLSQYWSGHWNMIILGSTNSTLLSVASGLIPIVILRNRYPLLREFKLYWGTLYHANAPPRTHIALCGTCCCVKNEHLVFKCFLVSHVLKSFKKSLSKKTTIVGDPHLTSPTDWAVRERRTLASSCTTVLMPPFVAAEVFSEVASSVDASTHVFVCKARDDWPETAATFGFVWVTRRTASQPHCFSLDQSFWFQSILRMVLGWFDCNNCISCCWVS